MENLTWVSLEFWIELGSKRNKNLNISFETNSSHYSFIIEELKIANFFKKKTKSTWSIWLSHDGTNDSRSRTCISWQLSSKVAHLIREKSKVSTKLQKNCEKNSENFAKLFESELCKRLKLRSRPLAPISWGLGPRWSQIR